MKIAVPREWRIPFWAIAFIAVALGGSTVAGRINEMRHIPGLDLQQQQDFAVKLSFEPERFHIEAFQDAGRYQGWHDGHAIIMAADAEGLRRLARNYWIDSIKPVEEVE